MYLKILLTATVLSLILFSCKDEDCDAKYPVLLIPDLTFSYNITGEFEKSDSWISPGNIAEAGGHENVVESNFKPSYDILSITSNSSEYSLWMRTSEMHEISIGTYDISFAGYGDTLNGSYTRYTGGTLTIDSVTFITEDCYATYFAIDGSFATYMQDSSVPRNRIDITGNFSGLVPKTK